MDWFFVKINDIDKSLASLIRKKEKTQITNIKNERGNITTNPTEYKRIIREYYELDANKFDNSDEPIKFLKGTNYKSSLEKK